MIWILDWITLILQLIGLWVLINWAIDFIDNRVEAHRQRKRTKKLLLSTWYGKGAWCHSCKTIRNLSHLDNPAAIHLNSRANR